MLLAQTPEEKLQAAGYTLSTVSPPVANYVNVVRSGNLLFLAGKGPTQADGKYISAQATTESGQQLPHFSPP